MFITAPGLVQHLHPSQVAPPQSRWRALTLSMERPWYLLVHRVVCGGRPQSQTSLVAWDETLIDLMACMPVADITAVARLDRCTGAGPAWGLHWVGALWAAAPGEAALLGPLLFTLGTDPQVRNTRLLPVGDAPGRRLLFSAAPGAWAPGAP